MAIEMVLQTDDSVDLSELIDLLVNCGGSVPEELPSGNMRGYFQLSNMQYFIGSDVAKEFFPEDIPAPRWNFGHSVTFRYSHGNHDGNIAVVRSCVQRLVAETSANFILSFQREETHSYREAGTVHQVLPF
jgi:hypothetical protein